MDELEYLQEEFRETLEKLRGKIKNWEIRIEEIETWKNFLQKDMQQVSGVKNGINKEILESISYLEKGFSDQQSKIKNLQKKWELMLFFQIFLIMFLFFYF